VINVSTHTAEGEDQDVAMYTCTQYMSTAHSCVRVGRTSSPRCSEDASQSVPLLQTKPVQCLLLTSIVSYS